MESDTGLACAPAIRLQGTVWEPEAVLEEHSGVERSGHPWFLSGSAVLPVTIALDLLRVTLDRNFLV